MLKRKDQHVLRSGGDGPKKARMTPVNWGKSGSYTTTKDSIILLMLRLKESFNKCERGVVANIVLRRKEQHVISSRGNG